MIAFFIVSLPQLIVVAIVPQLNFLNLRFLVAILAINGSILLH